MTISSLFYTLLLITRFLLNQLLPNSHPLRLYGGIHLVPRQFKAVPMPSKHSSLPVSLATFFSTKIPTKKPKVSLKLLKKIPGWIFTLHWTTQPVFNIFGSSTKNLKIALTIPLLRSMRTGSLLSVIRYFILIFPHLRNPAADNTNS
jgi:hypothetical protein